MPVAGTAVRVTSAESTRGNAVRFFLSRALSPRIQVNARWIGVNASQRKAFSISGKEPGSPLLAALAAPDAPRDATVSNAIGKLGIWDGNLSEGYLAWFREFNHGYPFMDYSKAETHAVDAELMGSYAALGAAPPLTTAWPGKQMLLPAGRLEPGRDQPASLELLSAWLQLAAGITHINPVRHSLAAYRTSPSGGARQPTDIGVAVGPGWAEFLSGGWWYDGLDHKLTEGAVAPAGPLPSAHPSAVIFSISSHVERSMWRYRDARAVRPVAIDAGHVAATLIEVIRASGWRAWWEPAADFSLASGTLDPVFGYVLAAPDDQCPGRAAPEPLLRRAGEGVLRTNPLLSLVPTVDGVFGENHAWHGVGCGLSPAMIDALAWATPSSRNDRPTSPADLTQRYLSEAELAALIDTGLLASAEDCDALWQAARPWFDHDWYLSLLALASERPQVSQRTRYEQQGLPDLADRLGSALDGRRTARALVAESPPPDRAESVISLLRNAPQTLEVLITAFNGFGPLEKGVYRISTDGIERTDLLLPSEAQVRAAAIGQPWARNFAAIVWLVPRPEQAAGDWIAAFTEAGILGQRIALLLSDDPTIGVFQSPALVDEVMPELVGTSAKIDGAYLIGLGRVSEGATPLPREEVRRFRPSDCVVSVGNA